MNTPFAVAVLVVAGTASSLVSEHARASTPPVGVSIDCDAIASDLGIRIAPADADWLLTAIAELPAGMVTVESPFTLFLPLRSAIDEIPQNVHDAVMSDPELLASILNYHLIPGQGLSSDALLAAGEVVTAEGSSLTFAVENDALTVNGDVTAVCHDLAWADTDSVIYIIDGVLQPGDPIGTGPASSVPGSSVPSSVPGSTPVSTA